VLRKLLENVVQINTPAFHHLRKIDHIIQVVLVAILTLRFTTANSNLKCPAENCANNCMSVSYAKNKNALRASQLGSPLTNDVQ
jgi:hypothetical protein